uniref:Myosinlike protein putative n=1 Tax=Albugo laibachii Nc14 TaxID=890382 RepID=F0W838_9STRA|nr:myosinlike protein putative [Albugo laibachii Nc14]|eukprot:CCA17321.1 myosinlike protein putative [Albugo laibachii Nc14]
MCRRNGSTQQSVADFTPGLKCYFAHSEHVWVPAEIHAVDIKSCTIELKINNSVFNLPPKHVILYNKDTILPLQDGSECQKSGVEDMVQLRHLHEASILQNIRQRFHCQVPYTYTGEICIAMNPYQRIESLYDERTIQKYNNLHNDSIHSLPPHVYAISVSAHQAMRLHRKNQSILVSGESGAGKTETTKIIMENLATIGAMEGDSHKHKTVQLILQMNPLLESFGNAQTVRNDNSSRFGKFTRLQFDPDGNFLIVGAKCQTYLLEKSRVVKQEQGERNFHIFYHLLYGLTSSKDSEHFFFSSKGSRINFAYLRPDEAEKINHEEMIRQLEHTKSSFDLLGLDPSSQRSILETIAGILHLGEVVFIKQETNQQESCAVDTKSANPSCKLLGFKLDDMVNALCFRTMHAANEEYRVPLSLDQAVTGRDALAKTLYANIFDWIVKKVNAVLTNEMNGLFTIGVLDIFGFESFQVNFFEQLCINYANEKLQQKFTHDVFQSVQVEYEQEGIEWGHIPYVDNCRVLQAIEGRLGIIALLNEEVTRPQGNETSFVRKLEQHSNAKHGEKLNHAIITIPRHSVTEFVIHHYAGSVQYEAKGFMKKHLDTLHGDLRELVRIKCSKQFIVDTFQEPPATSKSTLRRKSSHSTTVGTQFKNSLNNLMKCIEETNVRYIRCIKPNKKKSRDEFDAVMVADQLRCAGVIDAVRIARSGYPIRMAQADFIRNFSFLTKPSTSILDNCVFIMKGSNHTSPIDYQVGRSKIFLQDGVLARLEKLQAQRATKYAIRIQQCYRGYRARSHYHQSIRAIVKIQCYFRGWRHRNYLSQARNITIKIQAKWRRFACLKRYRLLQKELDCVQTEQECSGSDEEWERAYQEYIQLQSHLKEIKESNAKLKARLSDDSSSGADLSPFVNLQRQLHIREQRVELVQTDVSQLLQYVRGRRDFPMDELQDLIASLETSGGGQYGTIRGSTTGSLTRTISSEDPENALDFDESDDDDSLLSYTSRSSSNRESRLRLSSDSDSE